MFLDSTSSWLAWLPFTRQRIVLAAHPLEKKTNKNKVDTWLIYYNYRLVLILAIRTKFNTTKNEKRGQNVLLTRTKLSDNHEIAQIR